MMRAIRTAAVAAVLVMISACASSNAARLAQLDADQLFSEGEAALRAGEWDDAIEALERYTLTFPTHPRNQEGRFLLGSAYMGKEEYITAANEFSRLADDFPAGPWADDARFKVCQAYGELSPHPQLDQEYTQGAIEHCQSLITYYPDSEFVPRAQEILDSMLAKLAEKQYQTGEFYRKRGAIDSAIMYYESMIAQYPNSPAVPKALLRLYESYSEIGYTQEADAARERLLREFPGSEQAREVSSGSAVEES
ncbi:MAG: outer membrane protein assembly factor BamD [Longimicrobiales bacterium]